MFGFLIKKWFFDLWDNLLFALMLNIVFSLLLGGGLGLTILAAPASSALVISIGLVCVVIFALYGAVVNRYTWDFAQGQSFQFSAFPRYFIAGLVPAFALGLITVFVILTASIGLPFYASMDNIVSTVALALLFWLLVFWGLTVQYYWPLNAQFEPKVRKLLKKSVLVFFDNPGFTIAMAIGSILIIVLSVATLSLFPGITGLLLWHQTGLKLRMYKYDYLDTLKDDTTPRRKIKIPWDEILADEKDKVGKRTLRGMIFPWRD